MADWRLFGKSKRTALEPRELLQKELEERVGLE